MKDPLKLKNWVLHAGFWMVSFKVLYDIFKEGTIFNRADLIYSFTFLITLIIPVYINLRILIPGLFSKNRYILYGFFFIILIPVFSMVNDQIFSVLIDYVFPGYYFISYYDFYDLMKFFIVFLVITTLLKLSKSWFLVNEAQKKLAKLEQEKVENELLALKAQINPHFMFNSLNNIYSLALKKSDKAPGAIVKLGNILRYVIYRGAEDKVKLKDELEILEQYIELQALRTNKAEIIFEKDIQNPSLEISPLIFLPLIENGFKHGVKADIKGAYLRIRLRSVNGVVSFTSRNNKGMIDNIEKEDYKGIGLENVKRRLELSYQGNYEFHIFDNKDSFRTELNIRIHE